MRGKYSILNKDYIMNMMKQMTYKEKENIKTKTFDELWRDIWGSDVISNQYKLEEIISRQKIESLKNGVLNKHEYYTLNTLLDESYGYETWGEPEWGFPKGRRNYQEKDYECAVREFKEETGLHDRILRTIHNVVPFEEIFSGSNYKSYKHKYFVSNVPYNESLMIHTFEQSEVSKMEWKSYDECIDSMRCYNLEKKRLIQNVHNALTKHLLL
jgi:8-oxo-dGTP pyrophosphatase MutT (NUDIX family)